MQKAHTPNQQAWPFTKPLEFLQKVKYGGAVGKLAAITVAALIVVAVIMASAWNNERVHIGGLIVVVLLVLAAFWRIAKTLDKHPELALLDGTEIVTMKRLEMAAKNKPVLEGSPMISDPAPPLIEPPRDDAE
jgi:hypothetical protein